MKHIECGRCSKSYPVIFEADSTQARTCSAEVAQGRLVGHYGSEIADMRVFDFAGAPPKEGTIFCDDCIRRGLRRGTLREADGHQVFSTTPEECDQMIKLLDEQGATPPAE